jgi:flavodoxin
VKALVIWESLTGTTHKAAERIAAGLRAGGVEATVSPVTRVDLAALQAADVVVVGSWTDGLVFVGQKPGRQSRLWSLPYLTGKRAFVYCTYAVDAGHAVDKLADIVRDRGAQVIGGQKVHRFHLERDCAATVQQVLAGVSA